VFLRELSCVDSNHRPCARSIFTITTLSTKSIKNVLFQLNTRLSPITRYMGILDVVKVVSVLLLEFSLNLLSFSMESFRQLRLIYLSCILVKTVSRLFVLELVVGKVVVSLVKSLEILGICIFLVTNSILFALLALFLLDNGLLLLVLRASRILSPLFIFLLLLLWSFNLRLLFR